MRKLIDIINEGGDPRSNHPAFAPDDRDGDVIDDDHDFVAVLHDMFTKVTKHLEDRQKIEKVYDLVLSGLTLEDSVNHVAQRDGMEPHQLKDEVVADYKIMRSNDATYDSGTGRMLVNILNPIIR